MYIYIYYVFNSLFDMQSLSYYSFWPDSVKEQITPHLFPLFRPFWSLLIHHGVKQSHPEAAKAVEDCSAQVARVRKILGRAQWPALHAVLREHPRIPRAQMARATACRGLRDTHKAKSGEWWLWYILGNSRVCGQGYNLLEPFWLITRRRSVLPWWNTGQQRMSNFTIEAFESVFQTLQWFKVIEFSILLARIEDIIEVLFPWPHS
jgi:hypothetical protein